MNKEIINTNAKAIHKRLGDVLGNEGNLLFGQQMELQECIDLASEIIEETDKELNKPLINTGTA